MQEPVDGAVRVAVPVGVCVVLQGRRLRTESGWTERRGKGERRPRFFVERAGAELSLAFLDEVHVVAHEAVELRLPGPRPGPVTGLVGIARRRPRRHGSSRVFDPSE
jgi:hypothetical protein